MSPRSFHKSPSALLLLPPMLLAGLVLQTAPATAAPQYTNHLRNASFEGGRTGWEAGAATKLTVVKDSHGKAGQLMTRRTKDVVLTTRPVTVRATAKGQRFVASALVRSSQLQNARLSIQQSKPGTARRVTTTSFRSGRAWKRVTVTARAASAGTVMQLRVRAIKLHPGQRFRVDNAQLAGSVVAPKVVTSSTPVVATSTAPVVTKVTGTSTTTTLPISWTVASNGHQVSGVFVGRNGTSAGGFGAYESSQISGKTGTFTFKSLKSATPYTVYVQPVVDGVRGAKTSTTVSTKAVVVTPPAVVTPDFTVGGAYLSNTDPAALEARAGKKFESSRTYWGATQVPAAITRVKADMAAGRAVSDISFKLPYSWSLMATGSGDAWAKDLSTKLQAAIAGSDHVVRIAMHHEPENDTGTNAGNTVAGRDAWKNMQARLAPFFDKAGIQYVVVLMGYHSLSTTSSLYPLWKLDACIPTTPAIKGIGYDLYETYGSQGSTKWKDWDTYFSRIKTFSEARHLSWGLSEVGVTEAAMTANPQWFNQIVTKMKANGGTWFDYFDTNLNSVSPWFMAADGAREKAFTAALRAN